MRNLRQICAATVLTLALALSTFAGQIDCTGAPAPAPTTTSQAGSDPAETNDATNNSVLRIILGLLF